MLRTTVEKKRKDKKESPKLDFNSRISIASLIVAIVALAITAFIGIWLSPSSSQFAKLLNKQDILLTKESQIDSISSLEIDKLIALNTTLSNEVALMSEQLSLNIKTQKEDSANTDRVYIGNKNRFSIASAQLESIIQQDFNPPVIRYTDTEMLYRIRDSIKLDFLNKIEPILKSQMDNPFLISVKDMATEWNNTEQSIYTCRNLMLGVVGAYFRKDVEKAIEQNLVNAEVSIINLASHTGMYMGYLNGTIVRSFGAPDAAKKERQLLDKLHISSYNDVIKFYGPHEIKASKKK